MKPFAISAAIVLGALAFSQGAKALDDKFERIKFQDYRLLLRDGHRAYEREDYATAFKQYTHNACLGDKSSQFALGTMYLMGEGVPPDGIRAYAWYVVAAESGEGDYERARDKIAALIPPEHQQAATELGNQYVQEYGSKATGMFCLSRAEAGTKIARLECKPPIDRVTGTIVVRKCE
jgi:TPR repeat protein